MNFESYSIRFTEKATENGFSAENITRFLAYAKPLITNNLPVIYSSSHLSSLVGYKTSYLARAVVFTPFFYRKFKIRKSNGGERILSEPLPSLKDIQYWILNNILEKVSPSLYAKAYIPGRGIKQNLVFHKDQPMVLKLDIKDFFGNIRRTQVERIFRKQMKYSVNVSNLLAKLCCLNECLPQGAPTSPYLSNLCMIDFDEKIANYCLINSIRYTRYADDMTFSGTFIVDDLIERVKSELKKITLELNEQKTKLMKQGTRQTVTGIVVNKKLQVSRLTRKKIRQAIYFIKRFGLERHLEKVKNTKKNYIRHLLGQVLFVLFINPSDEEFKNYKNFLYEMLNTEK